MVYELAKEELQIIEGNGGNKLIWARIVIGLLLIIIGLFSPYMSVAKEIGEREWSPVESHTYTIWEIAGNSDINKGFDLDDRIFPILVIFGCFLIFLGSLGLLFSNFRKLTKLGFVGSFLAGVLTFFTQIQTYNGFQKEITYLWPGTRVVFYSEIGMTLILVGSLLYMNAKTANNRSVEKSSARIEIELPRTNILRENTSILKRILIVVVASFLSIIANFIVFREPLNSVVGEQVKERILILFLLFSVGQGWMIGDFATGNLKSRVPLSKLSLIAGNTAIVGLMFGFLGGSFAEIGLIRAPIVESIITWAITGGGIAAFGFILFFTSNNQYKQTIGGTISGSIVTSMGGFFYLLIAHPVIPINQLSEMFIIPLIGAILGAILGGIIGYLGGIKGLYLLKSKSPLAFIGICGLFGSVIGFWSSPSILTIFRISGYSYLEIWYFPAVPAFLIGLWMGVGALVGLIIISLDLTKSNK